MGDVTAGAGAPGSVRLFGVRLSPFVEKVVRALQLKDIAFELVPVRSPADFKRWNPQTGKMPVLERDGDRYFDSTFILRKLDEWQPEPPLLSRDPKVAARQRFIEDWSDESLYWYVMALRWTDANAAATTAQVVGSMPIPVPMRVLVAPFVRRQIRAQAVAQGLVRLPLERILAELDLRFEELEVQLGDSPFFFAERPGTADLAVFGQLTALCSGPTPQGATLLHEHPALVAHQRRVEELAGARGGPETTRKAA
jgi:glutathione S-transferase